MGSNDDRRSDNVELLTPWQRRAWRVIATHVHAEAHVSPDDAKAFALYLVEGDPR